MSLKRVLLVDDEEACRAATTLLLRHLGYETVAVSSPEDALKHLGADRYDLVFTDNSMPRMTGAEMAGIIKTQWPGTPVLMYTASPPRSDSNADLVLDKPSTIRALQEALQSLLDPTGRSTNDPEPIDS